MTDYLTKCFELHEKGKKTIEIIENIYINYGAFDNNDNIYEYKKIIANEFNIALKDIKLIGSSHTSFSKKEGILKRKEVINDYDFAIIDTTLFNKYWSEIITNNSHIRSDKMQIFYEYLKKGKIHPLYLDRNSSIYKNITTNLNCIKADKKISICVYAFEKAFIKNLCDYLEKDFIEYFREKKAFKNEVKSMDKLSFKKLESLGEILNGR